MYADEKEWQAAGEKLAKAHREDDWAAARWIACAQAVGWDKKYTWAAKITRFSVGTCRQYENTARTFTQVNPALCFAHHRLIAALPAELRAEWLDRADREKLTVPQLDAALKKAVRRKSLRPRCIQVPIPSEVSGSLNLLARSRGVSGGPGISPGAMLLASIAAEYVNAPQRLHEVDLARARRSQKAHAAQRAGVTRWQNRVHDRVEELFRMYPDISDPGKFTAVYFQTYGEKFPMYAHGHTEFAERFRDCPTEDCHMGRYAQLDLGDEELSLERQLDKVEASLELADGWEEAQYLAALLPADIR